MLQKISYKDKVIGMLMPEKENNSFINQNLLKLTLAGFMRSQII
jgi:hypothetical protein